MKFCTENDLSIFEFHDSEFSFVSFDGKDLVVSASMVNIHKDTPQNPSNYDMEIASAQIIFHNFNSAAYEPGRVWKTGEDGKSYPVGPQVIFHEKDAIDRILEELQNEITVYHFVKKADSGYSIGGCGIEPYFEIDANSRTIAVPADFQKNGIAVVGDDSAEILVFKIDRYFDATDLYDNKEFYIQWETPSGRYYNKAYERVSDNFVACPYNGDYIIFGWPVHEELTGAAGNISLSVHILEYNDQNRENPIFSFNTQPVKLKVNQGSHIDNSYENLEADITYSHLQSRLMSTKSSGHNSQIKISTPYLIALSESIHDLVNGEFIFQVAGYTQADNSEEVFITDELSYDWSVEGAEDDYILASNIKSDKLPFFQKYVLEDGEYVLYDVEKHGENATLYIKISSLIVDKAGIYEVVFKNTYNTFVGVSDKTVFEVPGPANITFEAIENKEIVLNDNVDLVVSLTSDHSNDTVSYQWYKGDVAIIDAVSAKYEVTATRNNESKVGGTDSWNLIPQPELTLVTDLNATTTNRDELQFSVSSNVSFNTLTAKWYKNDEEVETKVVEYAGTLENIGFKLSQGVGIASGDEIYATVEADNGAAAITTSKCIIGDIE